MSASIAQLSFHLNISKSCKASFICIQFCLHRYLHLRAGRNRKGGTAPRRARRGPAGRCGGTRPSWPCGTPTRHHRGDLGMTRGPAAAPQPYEHSTGAGLRGCAAPLHPDGSKSWGMPWPVLPRGGKQRRGGKNAGCQRHHRPALPQEIALRN